jgi:CxxC motif-containing protein
MTASGDRSSGYVVTGNKCKKGYTYAVRELTNPTRILTSTVKVGSGAHKRLPVRTKEAIPKGRLFDCMRLIDTVVVRPPVRIGEVILADLLGTGVDLIASKSIEADQPDRSK